MVRNLTSLFRGSRGDGEDNSGLAARDRCLVCEAAFEESDLYARYRVCHLCGFHYSMTARERIDSLADPESFKEINRSVSSIDPLSFSSRDSYKKRIFRDQRRTGLTEAVVTGTCSIGGNPTMLIVMDFGFMGGSMGCVVGEKIALALEQAAKRKLPAIAIVTGGGARIQEGVLSLMQMAKTSIAATQLSDKGLPFVTVLANPATGQAYASFANLADIILAEPGAIVGFSPLRAIKESSSEPLPRGSHTAESQLEHGQLDGVTDRTKLKSLLAVILDLLGPQYSLPARRRGQRPHVEPQGSEAWSSVQLARHKSRPTSTDYMARLFTNFVELRGDRAYGDDPAIVCGFGQLGGQTVVVVGQERDKAEGEAARHEGRTSPEGFRKAQRAFRFATKFDLPLITLIDTPGPYLGLEAEERGLGGAIATTMAGMSQVGVPSLSVIIGEGGSEGALALGVADRVLMMENAIYSTISPEGAAEIIFQDEARADEVAESLKLTAQDCREYGIIDFIVPEPSGGAHADPDEAARQLRSVLLQELADLQTISMRRLLKNRYKKFRNMGEYSSRVRAAIHREVSSLQGLVASGVRRITRRQSGKPEEPLEEIPAGD